MLGLIEIRHGQGAFVSARSTTPVELSQMIARALATGLTHDLVEARRVIEGTIARLAAERRSESDLVELNSTLDSHQEALDAHGDPGVAAAKFHLDLAEAAHNDILASFASSLAEPQLERAGALYEFDASFAPWEIHEHRRILAAVAAADGDLANELARRHVDAMADHYCRSGAL